MTRVAIQYPQGGGRAEQKKTHINKAHITKESLVRVTNWAHMLGHCFSQVKCYFKKMSWTEGLINNINVFLTVPEAQKFKIKVPGRFDV